MTQTEREEFEKWIEEHHHHLRANDGSAFGFYSTAIIYPLWLERRKLERELEEAKEKVQTQAGRIAELFWNDCGTKRDRGANNCEFEGTHVCTLCTLADARRELSDLRAKLKRYEDGLQKIVDEITQEINSRPRYANLGKRGCIRRIESLLAAPSEGKDK